MQGFIATGQIVVVFALLALLANRDTDVLLVLGHAQDYPAP